MTATIDALVLDFARRVIEAYANKSVSACVDLLPTRQEDKLIDTVLPFRFGYQRRLAKRFTKQDLKDKSKTIDRIVGRSTNALAVTNLADVDTHGFVFDPRVEVQVIPRITIRMNERSEAARLVRPQIVVKDAAVVNGVIRNTHFLNIEIGERSRRDPDARTRFVAVHDQQVLSDLLTPVIGSEYSEYMASYEWEIHHGDLELERFDVETPLIVTGELTVNEPLMEIDASLVVFGTTRVRSLALQDVDNAFLMGGVVFEQVLVSAFTGPLKVIKKPIGPLVYTNCESTEISDASNVTCLVEEAIGTGHGDLRATVPADYLLTTEDDTVTVDLEALLGALRSGASVLR